MNDPPPATTVTDDERFMALALTLGRRGLGNVGVDVVSFFVAYAKPAEFEQPTENPLHDTTMNAQPTAMFRVSLGDERFDCRWRNGTRIFSSAS